MKKMSNIKIDMLGGCCPVQAEGTIEGKPFYFRARGASWSMSIGGSDVVGNPEWYYKQSYGDDAFSAGYMTEEEARTFINQSAKSYINKGNNMTYYKSKTYYKDVIKSQKAEIDLLKLLLETKPTIPVDYEAIDNLVASELRSVALNLSEYVLDGGIDAEDSLETLAGVLSVLEYYSTNSEFNQFINKIPEPVLDELIEQVEEDAQALNFADLGYKTYMAMATLGFITFETLVTQAMLQMQSNASK
jgi:hypothetical protein